jgi:hypothetical protein
LAFAAANPCIEPSGLIRRLVDALPAPHPNSKSKVRLPNVDEALNIGYAMHSADDPALNGHMTQRNARIVLEHFLSLRAEPNSPEEVYLNSVRAIVHSQSRGITRPKEQYVQDLKAADLRRRRQRKRIRELRRSSDWLNSAWRLLGPFILGLSGYLFARFSDCSCMS